MYKDLTNHNSSGYSSWGPVQRSSVHPPSPPAAASPLAKSAVDATVLKLGNYPNLENFALFPRTELRKSSIFYWLKDFLSFP